MKMILGRMEKIWIDFPETKPCIYEEISFCKNGHF